MAKFTTTITRTDTYEIEVDETLWDAQTIADWSKSFSDAETPEDIAKALAFAQMRFGQNQFFEGFGYVKTYRKDGSPTMAFKNLELLTDEEYCKGISIRLISEDEDIETEVEKIN